MSPCDTNNTPSRVRNALPCVHAGGTSRTGCAGRTSGTSRNGRTSGTSRNGRTSGAGRAGRASGTGRVNGASNARGAIASDQIKKRRV